MRPANVLHHLHWPIGCCSVWTGIGVLHGHRNEISVTISPSRSSILIIQHHYVFIIWIDWITHECIYGISTYALALIFLWAKMPMELFTVCERSKEILLWWKTKMKTTFVHCTSHWRALVYGRMNVRLFVLVEWVVDVECVIVRLHCRWRERDN